MKASFAIIVLFLCSFYPYKNAAIDTQEGRSAYELLNTIRTKPAAYSPILSVDLNAVKPMPNLRWNDTLAKAAEAKALDMANRNYFSHVDLDGLGMNYYINKAGYQLNKEFLKNDKSNFFESIYAGSVSGEDAIKDLIIDSKNPGLGHRNHLLGIGDWNASLTDIGIGFARTDGNSKYKSYMCVLIAKHNW